MKNGVLKYCVCSEGVGRQAQEGAQREDAPSDRKWAQAGATQQRWKGVREGRIGRVLSTMMCWFDVVRAVQGHDGRYQTHWKLRACVLYYWTCTTISLCLLRESCWIIEEDVQEESSIGHPLRLDCRSILVEFQRLVYSTCDGIGHDVPLYAFGASSSETGALPLLIRFIERRSMTRQIPRNSATSVNPTFVLQQL